MWCCHAPMSHAVTTSARKAPASRGWRARRDQGQGDGQEPPPAGCGPERRQGRRLPEEKRQLTDADLHHRPDRERQRTQAGRRPEMLDHQSIEGQGGDDDAQHDGQRHADGARDGREDDAVIERPVAAIPLAVPQRQAVRDGTGRCRYSLRRQVAAVPAEHAPPSSPPAPPPARAHPTAARGVPMRAPPPVPAGGGGRGRRLRHRRPGFGCGWGALAEIMNPPPTT